MTYGKAIESIYLRRRALATGSPYSITCIGRGADFLFRNGVLCFLRSNIVHVLDVHDTAETEVVFNLDIILRGWTKKFGSQARVKLLRFQDDVLAISVSVQQNRKIMILSTRLGVPPQNRILAAPSVSYGKEVILRTDANHLLVGIRENDAEGNREWIFTVHTLKKGNQASPKPRILCKVPSFESRTELGTTLVLEIVDGELWLMTSEITPEPEGSDPVSYYGGYRYTLDDLDFPPQYWRLQRRRQNEGPIHDHWTNLSLEKDERGRYVITESRKEWLAEHPDHALRSFYRMMFSPTRLANDVLDPETQGLVDYYKENLKEIDFVKEYLPDDETEYVGTLLSVLPDHVFKTWESATRSCQREYPSSYDNSISSPPGPSERMFSLTETPYRTYDGATSTFLEIVNDVSSSNSIQPSNVSLRLRAGHQGSHINLWPRDVSTVPRSLKTLLQPRALSSFRAFSDERCLVFGTRTSRNSPIVLISFDANMKYGQKLDARKAGMFGSLQTHSEVQGQAGSLVEQEIWDGYKASVGSKFAFDSPPSTPPGTSVYRSAVDEYPAIWTEELAWWREPPQTTQ